MSRIPPPGDTSGNLTVSAPGRVCLFGEHQDYLHLPVIPCAISLRLNLEGCRRSDTEVRIDLPDIGSTLSFDLNQTLPYLLERDYFRAGINVLRRHGYSFSRGFDCRVHGEIPISAGTSSSSAMVVAWINFLAAMSDQGRPLTAGESTQCAVETEVQEFGEPGGMMDQSSVSYGGVLFIRFSPVLSVELLNPRLKTFVLGDSGEPKHTKRVLAGVKDRVLALCERISGSHPEFSLQDVRLEDLPKVTKGLTPEEFLLIKSTIRNRDITLGAHHLLLQERLDEGVFGALLNEEQAILRDVLRVSTPMIDRMINAALEAGAYGGKINGSGGGGCMFAYAPEHPETVAGAIRDSGGKAYIVGMDSGVSVS